MRLIALLAGLASFGGASSVLAGDHSALEAPGVADAKASSPQESEIEAGAVDEEAHGDVRVEP